jgi:hypothetical protein
MHVTSQDFWLEVDQIVAQDIRDKHVIEQANGGGGLLKEKDIAEQLGRIMLNVLHAARQEILTASKGGDNTTNFSVKTLLISALANNTPVKFAALDKIRLLPDNLLYQHRDLLKTIVIKALKKYFGDNPRMDVDEESGVFWFQW